MKAYLGIDIGSISTNLVVLDENDQVVAKRYLMTAGRPIEAVKRGLKELAEELGPEVEVLGAGTTGSGRYLIGELVGADLIKNEITAQAAAAIHLDPSVDTIFEIGGQDSKFLSVDHGTVVDFNMNKVCAAGTGSFLEEQAEKLGLSIKEEFARLASRTSRPAPLGDRCTVFIESELNHQLQKGAGRPELCAGLAEAIVKNYLNKVVENRRVGANIFFQGGVAFNRAVVDAFGRITGRKITVPPHHEVTGAIGIALLAKRGRHWNKSGFKGFGVSRAEYQLKTYECKSCENLCEINMISVEGSDPLFYGGRCEKWEKRPRGREPVAGSREELPDLFKERDEIVFQNINSIDMPQARRNSSFVIRHSSLPLKIGLPRVLFFFERFPFWRTFFSELGFDVVLSPPTNPEIIRQAQEHSATEACFPITLVQGHVAELVRQKVDYLFLPSLINMEKADERFTESFNCPFIQALPYFVRAGLEIPEEINVLAPALEPQRGEKHFQRQLADLAAHLGESKAAARRAAAKAAREQERVKRRLKERGRQVLELIERQRIPALAVISRPYNGSDPALNLDIPRKLRDLGILAIPTEFLPVKRAEIAADFPNMYWNYGQKLLAAAQFIDRHPTLSAVHITNFRCGPDSFISHHLKEIITAKPFLQIEVDEHSSDTGVITRLEAFWDSLGGSRSRPAAGREQAGRVYLGSACGSRRTLYLPYMCDHSHALSAAMRAHGVEAEVLPVADAASLELGRQYSSGKECHPYIVTTGAFVKKLREPGFQPDRSAFVMAAASGPCRFGNYHQTQRRLLDRLGYPDVPIIAATARDAYTKALGLGIAFRRLAWQSIIAVDLLIKQTHQTRPYEKNPGESDALYALSLERICRAVEKNDGSLARVVREQGAAFHELPQAGHGSRPAIGIIGEIFLRCNPPCNADLVRRIEALGGEAWLAPSAEWGYYTNLGFIYESLMLGKPFDLAKGLLTDLVQKWDEHRLARHLKRTVRHLHEPSILKTLWYAAPYLHYSYKGEAVLSLGKAIDFAKKGAAGIINIFPFTCMPGTVVAAIGRRLRDDHGKIAWLDLPIDGNEGVNLETRLEAFIHQAKSARHIYHPPIFTF